MTASTEVNVRRFLVLALASTLLCLGGFAETPKQNSISPDTKTEQKSTIEAVSANPAGLKDSKQKLGYALGMAVGIQLRSQAIEVDTDLYMQGLKDVVAGGSTLLTEAEVRAVMGELQSELANKQAALQSEKALKNQKAGEAFLAENKTREGIRILESGLQYKVLKPGDGNKPTIGDTVVCHYRGTLIDGTEFDSSYKRQQPATFSVRKVIKGWSEALQLMPVGSKWQLFIPSNLAYGARGTGARGRIPPNATLIFELELVSIGAAASGSPALAQKESRMATEAPGGGAKELLPAISALSSIMVSYKLDPRITRGIHLGGERWITPPTYTRVQEPGKTLTVEARTFGVDATGRTKNIAARWTAADPEMVTVTPAGAHEVNINVHRAGESILEVASQGISKKLVLKAEFKNNGLVCNIADMKPAR